MKHIFGDGKLLEEALTHTSWAYENASRHNERLEFLGDAVLQLCCTEMLYQAFPGDREGVLHSYRTRLVSTGRLAQAARDWGLGDRARLGKGEAATGGRDKDRLLAGIFEAVLGAVYLDGGLRAAQDEVAGVFTADLATLPSVADARVTLHEWCQRMEGHPPAYVIAEETGPAHDRMFTVEVSGTDGPLGRGSGKSKKAASIEAASAAVAALGLA